MVMTTNNIDSLDVLKKVPLKGLVIRLTDANLYLLNAFESFKKDNITRLLKVINMANIDDFSKKVSNLYSIDDFTSYKEKLLNRVSHLTSRNDLLIQHLTLGDYKKKEYISKIDESQSLFRSLKLELSDIKADHSNQLLLLNSKYARIDIIYKELNRRYSLFMEWMESFDLRTKYPLSEKTINSLFKKDNAFYKLMIKYTFKSIFKMDDLDIQFLNIINGINKRNDIRKEYKLFSNLFDTFMQVAYEINTAKDNLLKIEEYLKQIESRMSETLKTTNAYNTKVKTQINYNAIQAQGLISVVDKNIFKTLSEYKQQEELVNEYKGMVLNIIPFAELMNLLNDNHDISSKAKKYELLINNNDSIIKLLENEMDAIKNTLEISNNINVFDIYDSYIDQIMPLRDLINFIHDYNIETLPDFIFKTDINKIQHRFDSIKELFCNKNR